MTTKSTKSTRWLKMEILVTGLRRAYQRGQMDAAQRYGRMLLDLSDRWENEAAVGCGR